MTVLVGKKKSNASSSLFSTKSLFTHGIFGLVCLYAGIQTGIASSANHHRATMCSSCDGLKSHKDDFKSGSRDGASKCEDSTKSTTSDHKDPQILTRSTSTFPAFMKNMFVEYGTVPREDFNRHLEIGVPLDETRPGAEDALILYTNERTLPTNKKLIKAKAKDALENCGTVKVILMEPSTRKSQSCLAILPQWESYYIHKFMRLPKTKGPLDMKKPLRYVSRSHVDKGTFAQVPDLVRHTEPSYQRMVEYLSNLPSLLDDLREILATMLEASTNPKSKTIIVQVCNYGQVELFHNYMCSAKARGLDVSHVFMFATDLRTYELCQELGIHAYYNEAIFGDMPEAAARGYGDRIFVKMMMAKVYCVHLVLSLGYNVLFQDVDMVWYKNPLPYLESAELAEWDMMFQDDGNRQPRYAPFSPNTGFYFVRFSEKTLYLFGMLLRSGDYVHRVSSHQAALTALLNEFVSGKGLRVKVWKKGDQTPFPGGFEYHRKKDLMKQIMSGKAHVEPYIFHMSWTKNKDNKKRYFQQLGEWFLRDKCLDGWDCCLEVANVTCHYRDKASKIPCRDSPNIDKGRPSFW